MENRKIRNGVFFFEKLHYLHKALKYIKQHDNMLQSLRKRAMSGLGASCSSSNNNNNNVGFFFSIDGGVVLFARALSSSSSCSGFVGTNGSSSSSRALSDGETRRWYSSKSGRGNAGGDYSRRRLEGIERFGRSFASSSFSSSSSSSSAGETSGATPKASSSSATTTKAPTTSLEMKSKRRAFRKKGVSKTFALNDQELFEDAPPTELKPNVQVEQYESKNDERSLKAVSTAISANTAILMCKLGGYAVSGSPSMLAESVHSVADIANQALLRYGIVSSKRKPDATHNYGYHRERFVWSLISATGVFFLGSGLSISHGVNALTATGGPQAAEKPEIALAILGASLALEAYSAYVAYEALKLNAIDRGMTMTQFIKSGRDPTSVSVLAEDAAAVAGCAIASAAILASKVTGVHAFDAVGSVCIGGLLGVTAMYLINSNRLMLLGKSLGQDKMSLLNEKMRKDPVVSEVYLAKSEELGPGTFRYAAELEFDGTAIVNRFLDRDNNREAFREEFKRGVLENDTKVIDDALVGYGRRVIISVGDEVDRIEKEIVELEPTIKYVDLETN